MCNVCVILLMCNNIINILLMCNEILILIMKWYYYY